MWAELTSEMKPGTLTEPTEFTFDIWEPRATDPIGKFCVSTDSGKVGLTGHNRCSIGAEPGTKIKVEKLRDEWSPAFVDS